MVAVTQYLNSLPCEHEILGNWTEIESGAYDARPKLKECIQVAQAQGATVLISKLDRIGRSIKLLVELTSAGVSFVSAENPNLDSFSAKIMMCCAERERELIGARVRSGLAVARSRGVKLGGPNPAASWKHAAKAIQERKNAFCANTLKVIREIESTGVTSQYRICQYLNLRGVKTARGKQWTITALRRVQESAGKLQAA